MVAVCCWKGGWPPTRACSSCEEPVLFQAGRPGHFVDLEFKLASLTSTIEAINGNLRRSIRSRRDASLEARDQGATRTGFVYNILVKRRVSAGMAVQIDCRLLADICHVGEGPAPEARPAGLAGPNRFVAA